MAALTEQMHLAEALGELATTLESVEFGPATADLAVERDRLVGTIRSFLVPRAIDPTAPLTVVLAGPTGSGKSTIANTLTGLDITPTGALRPTTTDPVVLTSPDRVGNYESIGGVRCRVIAGHAPVLDTIVLVDTPDIDSTSTAHREVAETLIDNADIVLFVTSALRYADEIPWQVLRRALSRGTPVINILNRVSPSTTGAIVDFRSRLAAAGLDDRIVTMSEHHLAEGSQQVPSLAIRSLRRRLFSIVADRERFADDVFTRVLRATVDQIGDVARSMAQLDDELSRLEADLSRDLAVRVSSIDFSGLGEGPGEGSSNRPLLPGTRRWKSGSGPTVANGSILVRRLVAIVEGDIRNWLVDGHDALHSRH
ncbi:MAG TPA: dynamin family protein, partial [Acidimicrobiia bacterium]